MFPPPNPPARPSTARPSSPGGRSGDESGTRGEGNGPGEAREAGPVWTAPARIESGMFAGKVMR
jgi:hypothetical protein